MANKKTKPKAKAVNAENKEPAAAEKQKNKSASARNFFSNYKTAIIALVSIFVIVSSSVVIYYTLISKPKQLVKDEVLDSVFNNNFNFDITVRKISDENLPAENIPGIFVTKLYEKEGVFAPGEIKTVDAEATGEVILINNSGASQSLVATTRLLSESGVLFRLKNAVKIPAHGEIKTLAYADKAGVGGNIEPANFTIPGLSESMQKLIYARSEAPMSGGTKEVGILNVEDVERAMESLKEEARSAAVEDFKNDADYAGNVVLPGLASAEILESDISAEVGAETKEFNVSAKIEVGILIFPEDNVIEKARAELNKLKIQNASSSVIRIENYKVNNFDRVSYTVNLKVQARAE